MRIGYVPVDLGQIALVGQVGQGAVTGVQPVLGGLRQHRVEERCGQTGNQIGAAAAVDRRRYRTDADAVFLFVAQEEEQRVLDDRAADVETGSPIALPAGERLLDRTADGRDLAHEIFICSAVAVIHRAVEIIGAALADRIDVGANATTRADVEVGRCQLIGFDSFLRNRAAQARKAVGLETERIAGVDLVDRDAVIAEVLAVGGNGLRVAIGDRDARIHTRDTLERIIAVDSRFELGMRDIRLQTFVVRVEHRKLCGIRRHRDTFELFGSAGCRLRQVDRSALRQIQKDVVGIDFLDPAALRFDVIGPTDAQALRLIASAGIGDRIRRGAGRHMHDMDFGAGDGVALPIEHSTRDTRCRVLCVGGRHPENRGKHERQQFFLHSRLHHFFALLCAVDTLIQPFVENRVAQHVRRRSMEID